MEQFKALQVRLSPELHRKFRLHSLECGLGMSEMVKGWIEGALGMAGSAPKRAVVELKQTAVKPDSQTEGYVKVIRGEPLDEPAKATKTCWGCKNKVEKWTMDKMGHNWCDECIDNQRNAIP